MQLVTVRFTTKHIVSVFDATGKKIREYEEAIAQCITGIPRLTAETYRKFDNWKIEPYRMEPERRSKPNNDVGGRQDVGRATRSTKPSAVILEAAATGDFAAAINAGAK
jgi:hypothetical protein